MAVEFRVLHVGRVAAHVYGGQADTLLERGRQRMLLLGADDDGRVADHEVGILVRRGLDAAGDHLADVYVRAHGVGAQGVDDTPGQLFAAQADVQIARAGALLQTVEVLVEEGQAAIVQAQARPHPVTQHQA